MSATDRRVLAAQFSTRGYLNPAPVLSAAECTLLKKHLQLGPTIEPAGWWKGRAATDRLLYDIGTHDRLLELLRATLGNDIILWGASTVTRNPGDVHPWHVDIESAGRAGDFATVWLGICHTSQRSGLKLMAGSQHFPDTVQAHRQRERLARSAPTDDQVLAWAHSHAAETQIDCPAVGDGDAILFDGRIWHGSHYQPSDEHSDPAPRLALLLQYAKANAPVRRLKGKSLDWPFEYETARDRWPPVLLVSGKASAGRNAQVSEPPTSPPQAERLGTEHAAITLPLPEDLQSGWRQHPFFLGLTGIHDVMGAHASVLAPGKMPHPPHRHAEEELLLVLDGQGELLLGDSSITSEATPKQARAGTLAYYPAWQHHSIRNTGSTALTYLMLRWRGPAAASPQVLPATVTALPVSSDASSAAFETQLHFEGPTHYLGNLHVHSSLLAPAGGYRAHADEYDIAFLMLAGTVETMGRTLRARDLCYCPAGTVHGMHNPGPGPARYLVIEFHGTDRTTRRQRSRGETPYRSSKVYRRIAVRLRRVPLLRRLMPKPLASLARKLLP